MPLIFSLILTMHNHDTALCTYCGILFTLTAPAPCSNRGSLSNQFMKQKKQKPVAIGNSSLLTEQSLSPLVTNSQSAPSGKFQ